MHSDYPYDFVENIFYRKWIFLCCESRCIDWIGDGIETHTHNILFIKKIVVQIISKLLQVLLCWNINIFPGTFSSTIIIRKLNVNGDGKWYWTLQKEVVPYHHHTIFSICRFTIPCSIIYDIKTYKKTTTNFPSEFKIGFICSIWNSMRSLFPLW